jgi:hypothetical protein
VLAERAVALADALATGGVGARLLGPPHGLGGPALRLAAPQAWARPVVAAAFEAAVADVGGRAPSSAAAVADALNR